VRLRPHPALRDAGRAQDRALATGPAWIRGTRIAELVVTGVVVVAIGVSFVVPVLLGGTPTAFVVALLSAVGFALLHRRPVAALLLVAGAPVVAGLTGLDPTGSWSVAVFAAFLLALRLLPGVLVGAVIGTANLVAVALHEGGVSLDRPIATVAAVIGVVGATLGSALKSQQRYSEEVEGRARDAADSRRADIDRGVAEERLRIARDLHDSIGHEIAVVSMHLGSAQVKLPPELHEVRASLEAARTAVRAVLVETQEILRVLRVGAAKSDLLPTPDHHAIPGVVETARSAGLIVDATLVGIDRPLSATTSSAAYRIVQEILTNAHRHGTGAVTLKVVIENGVAIEAVNVIADPERGSAFPAGGNGLVGMAERAASADGTLNFWTEDNLFWVRAELRAVAEGPA